MNAWSNSNQKINSRSPVAKMSEQEVCQTAVATGLAESSGCPTAYRQNWNQAKTKVASTDWGLWQLNDYWQRKSPLGLFDRSRAQNDEKYNAAWAVWMARSQSQGFAQWSTFLPCWCKETDGKLKACSACDKVLVANSDSDCPAGCYYNPKRPYLAHMTVATAACKAYIAGTGQQRSCSSSSSSSSSPSSFSSRRERDVTPNRRPVNAHERRLRRSIASSTWTVQSAFTANMTAEADLGIILENDIKQGIHFMTDLVISWSWKLHQQFTKPIMHLSNVKLCVGTVLEHLLNMFTKLDPILSPLENVFGENGFLEKPVPIASFLLQRNFKMVDFLKFLYDAYCDGDCKFDGVFEALEMFIAMFVTIDKVENLISDLTKNGGCNDVSILLKDFKMFFGNGTNTAPTKPSDALQRPIFSKDPVITQKLNGLFPDLCPSTKKGINFPFLDHPVRTLVHMIEGNYNDQVMRMYIPGAVIGVSATIGPFPVWGVPLIELEANVGAGLGFLGTELILTTGAVRNAIVRKDPSQLLLGLSVPVVDSQGNPLYPLIGYVTLSGGLSVSILIFTGGVNVGIEAMVKIGLADIEKNGLMSIGDFRWLIQAKQLQHAFIMEVEIDMLFELYISACIPIPLGHLCWDIVDWKFKFPVWSHQFKSDALQVASPSGRINMAITSLIPNSMFTIYDADVGRTKIDVITAGTSMTDSTGSRNVVVNSATLTTDSDTSAQYAFQVQAFTGHLDFPGGSNGALHVDLASMKGSNGAFLAPTALTINKGATISIISSCEGITLVNPMNLMTMVISGTSCPTQIATNAATNITLSGCATDFSPTNKIVLNGNVSSIKCSVLDTAFTLSSDTLMSKEGLSVEFSTGTVESVTLNGHPTDPSIVTIESIPQARHTSFLGGVNDDTIRIPNILTLKSHFEGDGGPGIDGQGYTIPVGTTEPSQTVISPEYISHKPVNVAHNITASTKNVEIRTFNFMVTNENAKALSMFTGGRTGDHNLFNTRGLPGSFVSHSISGTERGAQTKYHFDGPGDFEVHLGTTGESMENFEGALLITGADHPDQQLTLFIHAGRDPRTIHINIDRHVISITDEQWGQGDFRISHWAVDNVIIETSGHVFVDHGPGMSLNTTTVINLTPHVKQVEYWFAPAATNWQWNNTVSIARTSGNVIIHGLINQVDFGQVPAGSTTIPENDCGNKGRNCTNPPLAGIDAPVVIVQEAENVTARINFHTASSPSAVAQHYFLEGNTINSATNDGAGTLLVPSVNVTTAVETYLAALGVALPVSDSGAAVYHIGNVSLSFMTGGEPDTLRAFKVDVPLYADMGGEDDYFRGEEITGTFGLTCGPGNDRVFLQAPLSTGAVDVGNETESADYVSVNGHSSDVGARKLPSGGEQLTGVSPNPADKIAIHGLQWMSMVELDRPLPPCRNCGKVTRKSSLPNAPAIAIPPLETDLTVSKMHVQPTETADGLVYNADCEMLPFRLIRLNGNGSHTINAPLTASQCVVSIYGKQTAAQMSKIITSAEDLAGASSIYLDDGSIHIVNERHPAFQRLTYQNVKTIQIQASKYSTHVTTNQGDPVAGIFLTLPAALPGHQHLLDVRGTSAPVLVKGHPHYIQIGQPPSHNFPMDPTTLILHQLTILPGDDSNENEISAVANINFNAGRHPDANSQSLGIQGNCFSKLDDNHSPIPPSELVARYPASAEYCDALHAAGLPADACRSTCVLQIHIPHNIYIQMGGGNDTLLVDTCKALNFHAELGGGDDTVAYGNTKTPAHISLSGPESFLGCDSNDIRISEPIGRVMIDMGNATKRQEITGNYNLFREYYIQGVQTVSPQVFRPYGNSVYDSIIFQTLMGFHDKVLLLPLDRPSAVKALRDERSLNELPEGGTQEEDEDEDEDEDGDVSSSSWSTSTSSPLSLISPSLASPPVPQFPADCVSITWQDQGPLYVRCAEHPQKNFCVENFANDTAVTFECKDSIGVTIYIDRSSIDPLSAVTVDVIGSPDIAVVVANNASDELDFHGFPQEGGQFTALRQRHLTILIDQVNNVKIVSPGTVKIDGALATTNLVVDADVSILPQILQLGCNVLARNCRGCVIPSGIFHSPYSIILADKGTEAEVQVLPDDNVDIQTGCISSSSAALPSSGYTPWMINEAILLDITIPDKCRLYINNTGEIQVNGKSATVANLVDQTAFLELTTATAMTLTEATPWNGPTSIGGNTITSPLGYRVAMNGASEDKQAVVQTIMDDVTVVCTSDTSVPITAWQILNTGSSKNVTGVGLSWGHSNRCDGRLLSSIESKAVYAVHGTAADTLQLNIQQQRQQQQQDRHSDMLESGRSSGGSTLTMLVITVANTPVTFTSYDYGTVHNSYSLDKVTASLYAGQTNSTTIVQGEYVHLTAYFASHLVLQSGGAALFTLKDVPVNDVVLWTASTGVDGLGTVSTDVVVSNCTGCDVSLGSDGTSILVGSDTKATVTAGSDATRSLIDGCYTVESSLPRVLSAFLQDFLTAQGVSVPVEYKCDAFFGNTNAITLSSTNNINIQDLNGHIKVLTLPSTMASLTVRDTVGWGDSKASVSRTSFAVTDEYTIVLPSSDLTTTTTTHVKIQTVDSVGLSISCGAKSSKDRDIVWDVWMDAVAIQNKIDSRQVTRWSQSSCRGTVYNTGRMNMVMLDASASPSASPIATIGYHDVSVGAVTLSDIQAVNISVRTGGTPTEVVINPAVPWSVSLESLTAGYIVNARTPDGDASIPHVDVAPDFKGNLTIHSESNIVMSYDLSFDSKDRTISSRQGRDKYCLTASACTPDSWDRDEELGKDHCMSKHAEEVCEQDATVMLNFDVHHVRCDGDTSTADREDLTLTFSGNTQHQWDESQGSSKVIVEAVFAISCLVLLIAVRYPLVFWPTLGMFSMLWFSAILHKFGTQSVSTSFQFSARHAVAYLFQEPTCGTDGIGNPISRFGNSGFVILMFVLSVVSVLLRGYLGYDLESSTRKRKNYDGSGWRYTLRTRPIFFLEGIPRGMKMKYSDLDSWVDTAVLLLVTCIIYVNILILAPAAATEVVWDKHNVMMTILLLLSLIASCLQVLYNLVSPRWTPPEFLWRSGEYTPQETTPIPLNPRKNLMETIRIVVFLTIPIILLVASSKDMNVDVVSSESGSAATAFLLVLLSSILAAYSITSEVAAPFLFTDRPKVLICCGIAFVALQLSVLAGLVFGTTETHARDGWLALLAVYSSFHLTMIYISYRRGCAPVPLPNVANIDPSRDRDTEMEEDDDLLSTYGKL